MLTLTDRSWLQTQRDLLMSASAKADVYGHALALTYDTPGHWWRPFHTWKTHRVRVCLARKRDVWADAAARRLVVIDAWIAVYEITLGNSRGPTSPAEREVWSSERLKRTL